MNQNISFSFGSTNRKRKTVTLFSKWKIKITFVTPIIPSLSVANECYLSIYMYNHLPICLSAWSPICLSSNHPSSVNVHPSIHPINTYSYTLFRVWRVKHWRANWKKQFRLRCHSAILSYCHLNAHTWSINRWLRQSALQSLAYTIPLTYSWFTLEIWH